MIITWKTNTDDASNETPIRHSTSNFAMIDKICQILQFQKLIKLDNLMKLTNTNMDPNIPTANNNVI